MSALLSTRWIRLIRNCIACAIVILLIGSTFTPKLRESYFGTEEDDITYATEDDLLQEKPDSYDEPAQPQNDIQPQQPTDSELDIVVDNDPRAFFKRIFKVIYDLGKPQCEPMKSPTKNADNMGVDDESGPVYTKEYLASLIEVSPEQVSSMKKSHSDVVRALPNQYPKGFYKGNGIVYAGGGNFDWYALLSIKQLRSLGCVLPVEVLIASEEDYDSDICNRIYPAYGAKCLYLPSILGQEVMSKFPVKGYQLKSLAMLVSSFENILLLDSDNVPVVSPDILFKSEPFNSTGFVLWPDFWKRTTSPSFYDITGVMLDPSVRTSKGYATYGKFEKPNCPPDKILLHQMGGALPDPSTESGQLMLSKKTHFKDMLLALYYNIYGPKYYYPLLSQGAAGEGDKETFLAAAHVLKKPYYQVRKLVQAIGMFKNGDFHGVAMAQSNALEDYNLKVKYELSTEEVHEDPSIMFMHINFPKLDPIKMKKEGLTYDPETQKRNRIFGDGFTDRVGYDFELAQWKGMDALVCENGLLFRLFATKGIPKETMCDEIKAQRRYLESTTKTVSH